MPSFGTRSKERMEVSHPDIRRLLWSVVKVFNITVLCTHREKDDQNEAFEKGFSKLKWPDSKHNSLPCRAVDIAPWPEVYGRTPEERAAAHINFALLAGFVLSHAKALDIPVRWGGDWNRNLTTTDDTFKDFAHFELNI